MNMIPKTLRPGKAGLEATTCLASVFGDIIIDDFEQEPEGAILPDSRSGTGLPLPNSL
jgi:hypothetical protein